MGSVLSFLFVIGVIAIPISVAIVRNRRYAKATALAHMQGWLPGNPDLGKTLGFFEVAPSPYGTTGPRVVREERTALGKRAWIAACPAAPAVAPVDPVAKESEPAISSAEDDTTAAGSTLVDAAPRPTKTGVVSADVPEVRVLGRPEVIGWQREPTRRAVPELACFLALHSDRNVPGEEIRAAMWPGDLETTESSMKHLHNVVSRLRTCLGKEYVPVTSKGSGYRLSPEIRTDWDRFQELTGRAANGEGDEAELLREALGLVRGAPFEGVAPGTFTWAWTELFVARIEVSVTKAAVRLSSLLLEAGDVAGSRWAVFQGLSAVPYDRELWGIFLKIAASEGSGQLDQAVKHATSVLGDDIHEFDSLVGVLRTPCPWK